jgi:hypothetical protein
MSADTTGIGALRNRLDPHFGQPIMCFEAITVILLRISARTRFGPATVTARARSASSVSSNAEHSGHSSVDPYGYRYRALPDTTGGVS